MKGKVMGWGRFLVLWSGLASPVREMTAGVERNDLRWESPGRNVQGKMELGV